MEARPYQIKQVKETVEAVSDWRKVLVQLPTGGGKTVEFSMLCDQFVHSIQEHMQNSDRSVLILVHREELMYQASRTITAVTGIHTINITSDTKHFRIGRIYIGMVESTLSRLNMFANIGLVIIDECHINIFNKVHSVFLEELIIGFTATPISASKKEPLNKYYRKIIPGPQIQELIDWGYLSQSRTRVAASQIDYAKFSFDAKKGDFNERQMADEYKEARNVANVVRAYHRYCIGEKAIVFNVTIDHSREVEKYLKACGFNVRHLASDNQHERKEILQWFKETKDAILCNVMIATVGYDEPTVRNIILNFDTLSLPKYLQCCGRGGRIITPEYIDQYQKDYKYDLQLKSHFNIIDLGQNYSRFGDWNWDRDWKYIFEHPDMPGNGLAPVKTCPECRGLCHAAVRVCPNTTPEGELCLYEFQRRETPEEKELKEMILVTNDINLEEILSVAPKKHKYYPMYEMGIGVVQSLFHQHKNPSVDIVSKFFKIYYKMCCQWYKEHMSQDEDNIESIEDSGYHINKAKNNFNNIIKKKNYQTSAVPDTVFYNWKDL